jgi:TRAP-type C4-dicarboxylate transport system substrate-binding protein
MKKLVSALLAVLLVLALVACTKKESAANAAPADDGKVYELSFSIQNAPGTLLPNLYQEMADDISKKTNGKVKITIYAGGTLATHTQVYDVVRDGGADMGWMFATYFPGQLPLTNVITAPMLGSQNVQHGAQVLWDLWESTSFPQMKNELEKDFHVLMMYTNPVNYLFSRTPVTKVADLRGLTIRSTGSGITACMQGWGANVVATAANEIYDGMAKNNFQGFTQDYTAIFDWSLLDVTPYITDLPLYVGPFITIMNKQSYDSLPKEYQAALDSWTGRAASLKIADAYQKFAEESEVKFLAKNKAVTVSTADRAAFQAVADKYGEDWAKQYATPTFDAQAYYNFCRESFKKHAR